MRYDERTFTAADGATIYRQQWLPEGDPKAVVCIVHGHGEHSGRYGNVVDALLQRGFAVFTFDLRGHGKSSGTRGDLRFAETMEDIDELLADAQQQVPGVPVILYGHSLGGLLSMTYTVQRQPDLAAHVSTAPLLDTELREQWLKVTLANILGNVLPWVTLPVGGDAQGISRDPEVVAAYEADPMVHDKASFAFAKQSLEAMNDLREIDKYPVPLLLIHGTADEWTIPAASREFAERVSGDVTLYEYEGLYHEPHHEPEKEQIFADIMEWLESRVDLD